MQHTQQTEETAFMTYYILDRIRKTFLKTRSKSYYMCPTLSGLLEFQFGELRKISLT